MGRVIGNDLVESFKFILVNNMFYFGGGGLGSVGRTSFWDFFFKDMFIYCIIIIKLFTAVKVSWLFIV